MVLTEGCGNQGIIQTLGETVKTTTCGWRKSMCDYMATGDTPCLDMINIVQKGQKKWCVKGYLYEEKVLSCEFRIEWEVSSR